MKVPGGGGGLNFPGEILRGILEFLYKILFICLSFSLATRFYMWRCSEGIIWGKISAGLELSG